MTNKSDLEFQRQLSDVSDCVSPLGVRRFTEQQPSAFALRALRPFADPQKKQGKINNGHWQGMTGEVRQTEKQALMSLNDIKKLVERSSSS